MKDQVTTLNEIVPNLFLKMDDRKEWTFQVEPLTNLPLSNGWFDVGTRTAFVNAGQIFAYTDEIDVSGWGNQGLTFFPMQAGVQEGTNYTYLIDDSLEVLDIISDSPLDVGMFVQGNLVEQGRRLTVPALYQLTGSAFSDGSVTSDPADRVYPPLGWENVLYGNYRLFQHNDNLQGLLVLPVLNNDFGSMNPTATDKLYITRIVKCGTGNTVQTGGFSYQPATRFIIKGMLKSETDLSYIYRLKDSFKSTQTDVGYNGL